MMNLRVALTAVWYRFLNEKAYAGNFIAAMSSAVFYTITYMLFIHLIFDRVGAVAGYSKNDVMVIYMFMQAGFFLSLTLMYDSCLELIAQINNGLFDLTLLRPVSVKVWSQFMGFRPVAFLMDFVPSATIVAILIDWSLVDTNIAQIIAGVIILVCGIVVMGTVLFLLSLPAFSQGDSTELLHVFWGLDPGPIPYDKLPRPVKVAAFSMIPTLLYSAVATAVFLGKLNVIFGLSMAICAAVLAVILKNYLWQRALKSYTSASS